MAARKIFRCAEGVTSTPRRGTAIMYQGTVQTELYHRMDAFCEVSVRTLYKKKRIAGERKILSFSDQSPLRKVFSMRHRYLLTCLFLLAFIASKKRQVRRYRCLIENTFLRGD